MTPDLLFDLGGVIMEIDRMRAVEAFAALGMENADAFFDPYVQRGYFGMLEAGEISATQFRNDIRQLFSRRVSDEEIDAGLCRFLIGIPDERLERLAALRNAGHRVYMLSNTNPIMWQAFILPEFCKLGGSISDYFDGVVTSFEVGCCKPDERIFRYACERFGLNPAQTTFYDDGAGNVDAARRLGFNAELVSADNSFMQLTQL